MARLSKEIHEGVTILLIDYSDLKEAQLIALLNEAIDLVIRENEPRLVLVQFNERSFITPAFLRRAEQINKEYGHLIRCQAFIGLSDVKKFILKGFNLFLGKNYKAFETKEEAIRHLLDECKLK